jgi:hypothetical protein
LPKVAVPVAVMSPSVSLSVIVWLPGVSSGTVRPSRVGTLRVEL